MQFIYSFLLQVYITASIRKEITLYVSMYTYNMYSLFPPLRSMDFPLFFYFISRAGGISQLCKRHWQLGFLFLTYRAASSCQWQQLTETLRWIPAGPLLLLPSAASQKEDAWNHAGRSLSILQGADGEIALPQRKQLAGQLGPRGLPPEHWKRKQPCWLEAWKLRQLLRPRRWMLRQRDWTNQRRMKMVWWRMTEEEEAGDGS